MIDHRTSHWLLSGAALLAISLGGCSCDEGGPGLGQLRPELHLDVTELDFEQVPLGASKSLPLKIENRGQLPLIVCAQMPGEGQTAETACTELTRLEPEGGPFGVVYENLTEKGAWLVAETDARELIVTFSPIQEGPIEGKLTLFHNASNGPTAEVTLRGSGVRPMLDVSAVVLDFGEVTVGQRKELELTLTNRTQFAQPVALGPIDQVAVVFGTKLGEDTPSGQTLRVEVPGNGSLAIKVFFTPIEEGQAQNNLLVSYCPTCNVDVMLLGQGVKPVFEVVPSELNYGTLNEGQQETRTFTVRNVGVSAVTVHTLELEAGTTSEFTVSPAAVASLPVTLTAGQELAVDVVYLGSTPGMDNGRVQVATNAWENPDTGESEQVRYVNLIAVSTGPDINALPGAVNFGTVAIMGPPVTRNLILENAGNSPLTISDITLNTPGTEITVAMVPGVPAVVDPGSSVQVVLQYAAQDAGLDEAQLVVISDDRDESPLVINVSGIGGVPTTCAVQVAPPQVNFGLVERGRRAVLPVQVRNTGAQPCSISNLRTNGDPAFSLISNAGITVPPGGTQRVEIAYAPTAYGMHTGQMQFDSDDPVQPTVSVDLGGSSAASDIRVIPAELDFGVVPVTCRSTVRAVTIYNTGSNAVVVNRVYLDPTTTPEFELQPFSAPATIPAGGSVAVSMRYHPADIGSDSGVLFIEHSASIVPVAVPLRGDGQVTPTVTERFTQQPSPQVDVLFVVDNSCSMSEEQASLGNNLASFLTYANQEMIDYHIAVTTTDVQSANRGRFRGPFITPTTANADSTFRTMVTAGTGGSADEAGLEAAYLALTDPNLSGANAGFLRTDAALAIVVVSDEEDYSNRQVTFYENFFRNIKGPAASSQFSFSAVVTPVGGSCPAGVSAGRRYIQIAQSTGGVVESICTANWGTTLQNIGLNTFGLRRRFNLSSTPVPTTIAVRVDGMQVQSVTPGGQTRWRYDQPTNSVVFEAGSVPQASATIEITYTVACLP